MKPIRADFLYILIIIVVLTASAFAKDNIFAVVSSVFGVIYTILIGKGKPLGYYFGMVGTTCGSILAFSLSLWGNFMLHAFCFLPMEIAGLFAWKNNLNEKDKTVIKTKLSKKESILVLLASTALFMLMSFVFMNTKDAYPFIDSFITTLSLLGMYLTVKRCFEQWIVWTIVNASSVIMWLEVYIKGESVISVLIVRMVYLVLGIYFYLMWQKELKENFAK